jgi:hypothetical protein
MTEDPPEDVDREGDDCPHPALITYTEDGSRYRACRTCHAIWFVTDHAADPFADDEEDA